MVFYFLCIIYILLTIIRAVLSISYYHKLSVKEDYTSSESEFTFMQPILSGDPLLYETLLYNVEKFATSRFLWLVDKSDKEGKEIVLKIIKKDLKYADRIKVIYVDDVPQNMNPKIYKLSIGIHEVDTEYVIVLDDDTKVSVKEFPNMQQLLVEHENVLVTGIPYSQSQGNTVTQLTSAFINSNSLLTYFPIAYLQKHHTINGMFYATRTDTLLTIDAFEEIKDWVCDDYAIARYYEQCGYPLVQSIVPCEVTVSVRNTNAFIALMKRWLIFSFVYFKSNISFELILLIILPSIMPGVILVLSLFNGWLGIVVALVTLSVKYVITTVLSSTVFSRRGGILGSFYGFFCDVLLGPLSIYALFGKKTIHWRNKKIDMYDGRIHYVDEPR